MNFLLVLSLAVSVSAGILQQRVCAADNCLRETETQTFTATNFITATETISVTEIVTEGITKTTTDLTEEVGATVKKRQHTVIPTAIPAYASPCSGAIRYSSACSCLGLAVSTVTVASPSTTITVPTTVTFTETVSPTLDTTTITITDSTATVEQTIATRTETTAVATVTLSIRLRANGGAQDGKYIRFTSQTSPPIGFPYELSRFTTDIGQATSFKFDATTGYLKVAGSSYSLTVQGTLDSPLYVFNVNPAKASAANGVPLICTLSGVNLGCTVRGANVQIGWAPSPAFGGIVWAIGISSLDWGSFSGELMVLEAVIA
ncbi:hypothetical protein ABW20_dc0100424 [Dactylellina cionopaga]|nr:hypothetical protein ABW20_dc0100424 [Dactylellina cionopaga]